MSIPYPNQSGWMASIDDSVLLSQLSLPGIHDAAALHGGPSPECQNRPISQQLQIGVRLLDIRLCYVKSSRGGENFALHHGATYQWAYFDQNSDYSDNADCRSFVLQDCLSFLQDNPTECIVMSVKQEYSDISGQAFNEMLRTIFQKNGVDQYVYMDAAVPTLKAARQKIVIVNRAEAGLGIYWGDWDKELVASRDPLNRNLDVEDHYQEAVEANKWDYVSNHLDDAFAALPSSDTWYLTFSSCAGLLPNTYAAYMNPRLLGYFQGKTVGPKKRFGSVMMDFPDQPLVTQLIGAARAGFPASVPAPVTTATTPWLYDEYDGKISVNHDYGQDNRIVLAKPGNIGKLEILYQGGYGIINLRISDSNGSVVMPTWPFTDSKRGSGWVAGDFDGDLLTVSGAIDGMEFAYQGGYGIVNARVHLKGQGSTWQNWMTSVGQNDFQYTTDMFVSGGGIRAIGTWRQDKRGIVDAQCCYIK